MELETIFSGLIWLVLGFIIAMIFIKNKSSADPSSLKDEVADLKRYIDGKVNGLEDRFRTQQPIIMQAPAPGPQTTEKVELNAESVEVFNNRADADTSTSAGAKAYEPDNNDAILNIKPKE